MIGKIDKFALIEVLHDWNCWKKDPETGLPRESYLSRLKNFLATHQVVTITGPRRAGKSFVMRQMVGNLVEMGIQKENTLFVNLEDPRFVGISLRRKQEIENLEVYSKR